MGKVTTPITITNALDEGMAEQGILAQSQVRQVALNGVLADTGASMLCLPAPIIAQLGLRVHDEINIKTATGAARARRFRTVTLTVEGRSAPFECLELPGGSEPLLGYFPMETLGIELDLQNQRLILLPDHGDSTYLTA
jgi:predicted aspartyl protease